MKIRVILLEDTPSDAERIVQILQSDECTPTAVEHHTTLAAAIERAKSGDFDLALLDLCVPDSKGLGTFLRFHAEVPGLPVIVQSGLDDAALTLEAVRRGAQDYLHKDSIDTDVLRRAVRYSLERARIEEALRLSNERFELAVRGANDGLWDWDLRANRIFFSERWLEIVGCEEIALCRPQDWMDRVHPEDIERLAGALKAHLDRDKPHLEVEHRIMHGDGAYRWVKCRGLAVRDAQGHPTRMAGSMSDITQQKHAEARLQHEALHDSLTGLPNRTLFLDRLQHAVRRAQRHPDYTFAVLFLDLDRFKLINDGLGHGAGDQLLVHVARVLSASVRGEDLAARLGGDEFAAILDGVGGLEKAVATVERVRTALRRPLVVAGRELRTSVSIGIAHSDTGYEAVEVLMRDADAAMYRAKSYGRDAYVVFDEALHTAISNRLQLETELRDAIDRGELFLEYQPIVELATQCTVGHEALLRWHHPERGLVMPNDFVPILEDTGLIVPVGDWVLREACMTMASCARACRWLQGTTVSVNVSPKQFARPDFVERVIRNLRESGLEANRLVLEITENVLMACTDHTSRVLSELRSHGIRIDIDDFGTGYSSLSYLRNLPIDRLKIDRSFVDGMLEDGAIVGAIIAMGQRLGLGVTAEGIECRRHLRQLTRLHCGYGQGYLFGRPQPASSALAGLPVDWTDIHTPMQMAS